MKIKANLAITYTVDNELLRDSGYLMVEFVEVTIACHHCVAKLTSPFTCQLNGVILLDQTRHCKSNILGIWV